MLLHGEKDNQMTTTPAHKSKLSVFWNLFKIVLAIGLVLFILSKTDLTSLIASMETASFPWLAVSGVLYVLLTLLKALQYHVLIRDHLTYSQVLKVVIWQNAVSNFVLAGAGIVTYITIARMEHDVKVGRSVSIFLLTKVGDLIAMGLALGISSYVVWSSMEAIRTPVLVLLAGIGLVALVVIFTILFKERFISILGRFLDTTGLSKIALVKNGMMHLQNFAGMEREKILLTFFMLLVYSCLYQIVTVFWTYTSLLIFHLEVEMISVVFVSVLMQLVSYFPIHAFGGLGITETTALYFWSFFNIPQNVLAPVLIGNRIVFYLFNLIPLIYLPAYSAFIEPKEHAHNEQ